MVSDAPRASGSSECWPTGSATGAKTRIAWPLWTNRARWLKSRQAVSRKLDSVFGCGGHMERSWRPGVAGRPDLFVEPSAVFEPHGAGTSILGGFGVLNRRRSRILRRIDRGASTSLSRSNSVPLKEALRSSASATPRRAAISGARPSATPIPVARAPGIQSEITMPGKRSATSATSARVKMRAYGATI